MKRLTALLLVATAAPLAAQTAEPVAARPAEAITRAAATITEADVRQGIGVIAHDSMGGRDTPSRGLDLTAQYVADQFRKYGLKPGGNGGTYFQRYPITRKKVLPERSSITLSNAAGNVARASLAENAIIVRGAVPGAPVTGPVTLISGPITAEAAESLAVEGKIVMVVVDFSPAGARQATQAVRAMLARQPKALLLVSNRDTSLWRGALANQRRERVSIDDGAAASGVAVEIQQQAFAALPGLNFDSLRADTTVVVSDSTGLTARIDLQEQVIERVLAPNVIGIIEGSDSKLKGEYVVYSAHMDHVGVGEAVEGDSIYNGADDDASGTIGLVELAEAFSQKGARPKRSIMLVGVSGEEKGLWGSRYFSENPTIDLKNAVANINMDMIGRNWTDTIVAIGKEHSDLGATLNRVNAAHPELNMVAIDDIWPEERFYFRSDHYNFARKGVPVLFFFNGVHDDYHKPSDHPEKIGAEKEARILQLLFYIGQDVANAAERPKWNPDSYAEIVEGPGGR
jgi:hypothetical protein